MEKPIHIAMDLGNLNGNLVTVGRGEGDPLSRIIPLVATRRNQNGIDTTTMINSDLSLTVPITKDRDLFSSFAVASPKRLLSQENTVSRTDARSGETREVQLETILTAISQAMFDKAVPRLRSELHLEPGEEQEIVLALSYPASFMTEEAGRRQALLERYKKAVRSVTLPKGFRLDQIDTIPEPAAAAVSYLYDALEGSRATDADKESLTVFIFDLGHGTLDAALVQVTRENGKYRYDVLHTDGAPMVGGQDFDDVLWDLFLKKARAFDPGFQVPDSEISSRRLELRLEKESLASDASRASSIHLYQNINGKLIEIEITAGEFDNASFMLIDEARQVVERVMQYARTRQIPVDRVISTGGAGQMVCCLEMLEQATGVRPSVYDPYLSVASGALKYLVLNSKQEEEETESKSKPKPKPQPQTEPQPKPLPEPALQPRPEPVPVPVAPGKNEKHSTGRVILHPACRYALLDTSPTSWAGMLKPVISPDDALPFVSEEIPLSAGVEPLTEVRVYLCEDASPEVIENGYFISACFDTAKDAGNKVRVQLRLDTDMRLSVTCVGADGKRETKTANS